MSKRVCVLDVETTGLMVASDRVIEIGIAEVIDRKITQRSFHVLVNPGIPIPADVSEIHGITDAHVADQPTFDLVAESLLDFLGDAEIAAHNADFDVGFLDAELARIGHDRRIADHNQVTDTVALSRKRFPGQRASLDALCDRLGVDRTARHRHGALIDAQLLAEVYTAMTRGQGALFGADVAQTTPASRFLSILGEPGNQALRVVCASSDELDAHRERMAFIRKKAGSLREEF